MNNTEVRNAIQTHFLDSFNGQFPISLDNQPFTTPGDETPWERLSVQFNTTGTGTLGKKGSRKYTRGGFVFVQVFTPEDSATDLNDTMAKEALDLFDGESLGKLWFTEGSIRTIGVDGKWYQQNVVISFTFEETK